MDTVGRRSPEPPDGLRSGTVSNSRTAFAVATLRLGLKSRVLSLHQFQFGYAIYGQSRMISGQIFQSQLSVEVC
jgi:hypothetical protein